MKSIDKSVIEGGTRLIGLIQDVDIHIIMRRFIDEYLYEKGGDVYATTN